ncbi:MAG: cytochrome c [Geminicoccaceae bacterium]
MAQANCSMCHATGSDDPSPLPIAPEFRTFRDRWPVEVLAESLAEGIVTGHGGMPEFIFEPEQIDAFLAYLDSL